MPIIQTADITPTSLLGATAHQVYCGLDNCLTLEVRREEEPLLQNHPSAQTIYSFERALQAPYLSIMLRGFAIDQAARSRVTAELNDRIEHLQSILNEFAFPIWNKSLNPRSPKQLTEFFYDTLRFKQIWTSKKGVRKLSLDRNALEKLHAQYLYARPFVNIILGIRALAKQLEVFDTDIDSDGRFRTSYNIAGTETGRPSSSTNAFGTGGNAQNIAPSLRYIFIADQGMKLCNIDFEQVEARDVGWFIGCLFDDWTFLNSCESGDLHTANAKLIWPELGWANTVNDRQIADKQFYREFSYRDMAKRGGHLCLTDDHEVLTPYGWVPITAKPETILTWTEYKSAFQDVTNWIDEEYIGELHQFEGNSVSIVATPNHRVPYKTDQRNKGNIKVKKISEGPGIHMPLGDNYEGGNEIVPARLIAAFMSDGYQASTNRMHFHLRKERKINRLKYLCSLYGYKYDEFPKNETISVHGHLPKRASFLMFEWTRECLEDFLDEYKYWDGHVGETYTSLFSVDREHMEWLQTFGRILGIGGNLRHSVTKSSFGNSDKIYETDYYTLQQNNRKWAFGKNIKHSILPVQKVRVLCPTIPATFFYIRHKGKISITGNSNYMGTAWTAAQSLKVPITVMEEFQARYCKGSASIDPAYPGIPRYWQWIAQEIQTNYKLVTPFGRQRHFFGRPDDDATIREAIAFLPQSTTADRTNLVLWRVWKHMPEVQLLAQTYDSITFQYPEELDEDSIIRRALDLLRVEFNHPGGRRYSVPGEAKIGWNWGNQVTQSDVDRALAAGKKPPRLNEEGLKKWNPAKRDDRQRRSRI